MIFRVTRKFKSMPQWLGVVAGCGIVVGTIAVIAPFLPGDWTNEETGEHISKAEVWERGIAIEMILIGLYSLFISICIFRRISLVRYLVPLTFVSSAVYLYFSSDISPKIDMYCAIAWVVISGWYFFRVSSVTTYFKTN